MKKLISLYSSLFEFSRCRTSGFALDRVLKYTCSGSPLVLLEKTRNLLSIVFFLMLTSCASYSTTWECPKVKGIGCSSLEYADSVAREQILLNTAGNKSKKILINQDLLGEGEFKEIEVLK